MQALLFAGLLGVAALNTYIRSIVNKAVETAGVEEGLIYGFIPAGFISGFLPVGLITLILIQVNHTISATVA